jgi:effector-binding domain-containing protein
VSAQDLHDWWDGAFRELDAALAASGAHPVGPRAALYSADYFAFDTGGEVIAYVPIGGDVDGGGRARIREIAAAELAVAVHRGGYDDLDRTYGALGTYVAEREISVEGPIREHYLITPFDTDDEARHLTEVGWPIFRTAPPT